MGDSLRQTVHFHRASVHQTAKLVAALLRVAGVTAGLAESNGCLPPGLRLTSPAGWLPRTGISSGTLRSVMEYGLPLPFCHIKPCSIHPFCQLWLWHCSSGLSPVDQTRHMSYILSLIQLHNRWLHAASHHLPQLVANDNNRSPFLTTMQRAVICFYQVLCNGQCLASACIVTLPVWKKALYSAILVCLSTNQT